MKMKETASGPSHLPRTTLAFEKEKAMPHNFMKDLAEGFIVAKPRSSRGSLLKCHGSRQAPHGNHPAHAVSVLVGTRAAIHNWLRVSGPGKCVLWVEHGLKGEGGSKSRKNSSFVALELVYRQRDYRITHVQVLRGCKLVLRALKLSRAKNHKEVEMGSDGGESDGSRLCDHEFKHLGRRGNPTHAMASRETLASMQWNIVMKAIAFQKLNTMLACGGALWEFRRLLRQITNLPEFIDIDFCNLDLRKQLNHHPYCGFLIGCDAITIRTTSEDVFIWKIVRFGFHEGSVTLGGGKSLKGLLDCSGGCDAQNSRSKEDEDEEDDTSPSSLGDNENSSSCNDGDADGGSHALDWAVWRGVYQGGPLEAILKAVFGEEDDAMVLQSLTNFFSKWKGREQCRCCVSFDLGTAFRDCRHFVNSVSCWKLSSQERCALAHLRSVSDDVRRQGLRVLLDLLFDRKRELSLSNVLQRHAHSTAQRRPLQSTPASSRPTAAHPTAPLSFDSNLSPHLGKRENLNLLSGLMAVMDRPLTSRSLGKPKHFIGDQTQRALQAAQMKWSEFEDMKSDRSTAPAAAPLLNLLQWPQVLEWVDNGFLEALLREGTEAGEETHLIPVEDIAEACVQAVRILSGESTYHIVTRLISQLQEFVDVFGTCRIDAAHQLDPTKAPAPQIATARLRSSFATMPRFGRLLALLLSSSASIASTFAKSHGLSLILRLYSILTHKFPTNVGAFDMANHDIHDGVLPGEVHNLHNHQTTTYKAHAYHPPQPEPHPLWAIGHENKSSKPSLCKATMACEKPTSSLCLHSCFARNLMIVEDATSMAGDLASAASQEPLDGDKLGPMGKREEVVARDNLQLLTLERVIGIVWRTKLSLLQSFISVWESQSIFLNKFKAETKKKLLEETKSMEFLSWFHLDLMGGHLSTLGFAHVCENVTKSAFKVIYLLDNDLLDHNMFSRHQSQKNPCNIKYMKEGPLWSGPGPPPQTHESKSKLCGSMLMELKKQIDHKISHLVTTLSNHHLEGAQKFGTCKTILQKSNGTPFWMLWMDLACLLMGLSNYIIYWPTKESNFKDVLEYCGEDFHQVLSLLSNLGPASSWIPPQILTMQIILKILGLCIQGSTNMSTKKHWSPYLKTLWEMLIDKWTHWNCIQSYISWLTLEACQSCLNTLFDNFQETLNKSIHSYYFLLKRDLNAKGDFTNDFEIFYSSKFFKKKAVVILHSIVLLVEHKMSTYKDNLSQKSELPYFCDDEALWFLQEIMNPSHGLLFLAIKNKYIKECEECDTKISNWNSASEIIFNIKQQNLILLAQIFSLQFSTLKPHTNIFLTRKYLMPFLNVLYYNFANAYTKVLQQLRFASPHSSQESSLGGNETKCSSQSKDQNHPKTIESNHKLIHYTTCQLLSLCYSYAHVLLVVAKHINEDGRLIFKDLRVMDFLIYEISLEYEFLQVVESKSFCRVGTRVESHGTYSQPTTKRDANTTFQGVRSVNMKMDSNGIGCALPSLSDDYNIQNLIPMPREFLAPKIMEKNVLTVPSSILKPEDCIIDSQRMSKTCDNTHFEIAEFLKSSCNNTFLDTKLSSETNDCETRTHRNHKDGTKKTIYSGRFFDLNEEVEQELAKEDGDRCKELHSLILNMYNESSELDRETRFARIDSTTHNEETSLSSTSSTSSSERTTTTVEVTPTRANPPPRIPKLNLLANSFEKNQPCLEDHPCVQKLDLPFLKVGSASEDLSLSSPCQVSYDNERSKRPIYHNPSLHIILLELIIYLMLSPEGTLEVYYCDRFPMENQKLNAPFYLFYHINHTVNQYVVKTLAKRLDASHKSAFQIMKLTWQALFDSSIYTNRIQIAQGVQSQVYKATRRIVKDGVNNDEVVVLKFIDLPKGPHDPCNFFDVYSEVQILERFLGDLRVCQILDYGVEHDAFVLVLKHYKCNLRVWRQQHTNHLHCANYGHDDSTTTRPDEQRGPLFVKETFHGSLLKRLPLYLEIYGAVLQAVKALEVQNIVHYDLKCDNFLLEPLETLQSNEEFWKPQWPPQDAACAIPFRVSIADFGQSKASFEQGGECTGRHRGTECVKSPEMLKLLTGHASAASSSSMDDRLSLGKAGDIWGLGCLLYELLTGEYLLYDHDWVRFFMRVTQATEELIPDEKAAKLDNCSPIIEFLQFILVRDPHSRPSLQDLVEKLEQLQEVLKITTTTTKLEAAAMANVLDDEDNHKENGFEMGPKSLCRPEVVVCFPPPIQPFQCVKHHPFQRELPIPSVSFSQPKCGVSGSLDVVKTHEDNKEKKLFQFWQRCWMCCCCCCCWRNKDMVH